MHTALTPAIAIPAGHSSGSVTQQAVAIETHDGHTLGGTLFLPPEPRTRWQQPTIIGSATAVPQRFYARFATYLAAHGRPTLTFDYRGTGASAPQNLRGSKIRYRDWGIGDIPSVIDWVRHRFDVTGVHWVGHSYGGLATGLAANNARITRQFSIAAMAADYRYVEKRHEALNIALQLFLLAPMAAHTIGYVPARLAGGIALPKHVALEWAKWVRTPDFLFGVTDLPERANYARFTAPIRFAYAHDDSWLSKRGVDRLASKFVNSTERSVWRITPTEANGRAVGHIGFFRSDASDSLWPRALSWLNSDPDARASAL